MRLEGKTAIVTGGGSGFGAGIARNFIAQGAQVVIADINSAAAESLSDELGEAAFATFPNESLTLDFESDVSWDWCKDDSLSPQ